MSENAYGPIAEIRHATESPVALTVGGLFGGAAPLINYFTVHLGNLVWFDEVQKAVHVTLKSPLWFLVAGSFALSSKSVFRWARNTFGDIGSALGTVAMLEGALIFAPHPAMGVSALVFLVAINAAAYGSALGLRDQKDKALEAAAFALSPEEQPEKHQLIAQQQNVPVLSLPSETRSPKALPVRKSSPKPAYDAEDLYARAVAAVCGFSSVSVEMLRETLGIRQPTAAALMVRLERDGVVGDANPSDYGRRPVLIRAESA